jgi:hypothetical protein
MFILADLRAELANLPDDSTSLGPFMGGPQKCVGNIRKNRFLNVL